QDVWAGGTDMLLKLCETIVDDPTTEVPVKTKFTWAEKIVAGKVKGKIAVAQAVDIGGKGVNVLFIASDAGDRLFSWDAEKRAFADLAAKGKLDSKSVQSAWGDFNGDGRLDLASWDGKKLTLWQQAADGAFAAADVPAATTRPDCLGLAAVDAGVPGRAGLLWSSSGAPVLLVPDAQKAATFTPRPLTAGASALREPGAAGRCLVADFDGDALADVIQPFANGSLFFKGLGGGKFAEGVACAVALGTGRAASFIGDWDLDGKLDIFTVAEDTSRLWQNSGNGKFSDQFGFPLQQNLTGELTYISKPFGIAGNTCDFNGDGMQDLVLFYSQMTGSQLFFNRGFRSFGHGHSVDLEEGGLLPEVSKGQQAGVVADLDGDGAQDLLVVTLDGDVVFFPHKAEAEPPRVVRVALPAGGPYAGPLTVTATIGKKQNAWVVSPGTEAFLGRPGAGFVDFTWKLPGGEPRKKRIVLTDEPVRFEIPTAKP
ncbi:MAG: VCBS repeat-containing protein, partial [Phycisphaerae bacterium]|nr:VCBS repeat-containing protein [Phycisphaerae bacterium]